MSANSYVSIDNLTKVIRSRTVLDDVTISVGKGSVVGLQGPNGSGKTMLMRCICGLVYPTSGTVSVGGKVIGRELASPPSIGLILEGPAFLDAYSGLDNLMMLAAIGGVLGEKDVRQWLMRVGLDPDDRRRYRQYSLGMRQRLGIASAFMEEPDLLLLDEPTNALDTGGVQLVRELVGEARARGAAVLLSSHDAGVLSELSDEVWKLSEGHIDGHMQIGTGEAGPC